MDLAVTLGYMGQARGRGRDDRGGIRLAMEVGHAARARADLQQLRVDRGQRRLPAGGRGPPRGTGGDAQGGRRAVRRLDHGEPRRLRDPARATWRRPKRSSASRSSSPARSATNRSLGMRTRSRSASVLAIRGRVEEAQEAYDASAAILADEPGTPDEISPGSMLAAVIAQGSGRPARRAGAAPGRRSGTANLVRVRTRSCSPTSSAGARARGPSAR